MFRRWYKDTYTNTCVQTLFCTLTSMSTHMCTHVHVHLHLINRRIHATICQHAHCHAACWRHFHFPWRILVVGNIPEPLNLPLQSLPIEATQHYCSYVAWYFVRPHGDTIHDTYNETTYNWSLIMATMLNVKSIWITQSQRSEKNAEYSGGDDDNCEEKHQLMAIITMITSMKIILESDVRWKIIYESDNCVL